VNKRGVAVCVYSGDLVCCIAILKNIYMYIRVILTNGLYVYINNYFN